MSVIMSTAGGGNDYTVTVDTGSYDYLVDPKGPTFGTATAYGYDDGGSPYTGLAGSITPTSYAGAAIKSLYHEDVGSTTVLKVAGDKHTLLPVMLVNGVDQHLGTGSYDGTSTTWSSTSPVTDPFIAFNGSTVGVSIS